MEQAVYAPLSATQSRTEIEAGFFGMTTTAGGPPRVAGMTEMSARTDAAHSLTMLSSNSSRGSMDAMRLARGGRTMLRHRAVAVGCNRVLAGAVYRSFRLLNCESRDRAKHRSHLH